MSGSSIQFQSESASTSSQSILLGKRVVICEDEGITQLQFQHILKNAGMIVVGTAKNGREAVEVTLREQPDLVLMDYTMPVMNGLDAAEKILATGYRCIVMVTAQDEYRERAQQVGTAGYIVKPTFSGTLIPQLEAAYTSCQRQKAENDMS